MIAMPETATHANKKVVMPPKAEDGIATSAAANFAKTPMMIKKKQQK